MLHSISWRKEWTTKSYVLQDFTLDMYFRQFWQDPRLSFERRLGLEKLVVGAEYIQLIWVPDTFFVNEKTAYFHAATTENQFLRILHTGEILRSIRWVISEKTSVQQVKRKPQQYIFKWGQKPTSLCRSNIILAKERKSEIWISQGHIYTLLLRALAMITTFCKGHLLLKQPPTTTCVNPNFGRTSWKPPQEMRMFLSLQIISFIIL